MPIHAFPLLIVFDLCYTKGKLIFNNFLKSKNCTIFAD
jgi:hypothetical protein